MSPEQRRPSGIGAAAAKAVAAVPVSPSPEKVSSFKQQQLASPAKRLASFRAQQQASAPPKAFSSFRSSSQKAAEPIKKEVDSDEEEWERVKEKARTQTPPRTSASQSPAPKNSPLTKVQYICRIPLYSEAVLYLSLATSQASRPFHFLHPFISVICALEAGEF